eukprot:TRINITY_DN43048_c0_g1_i1.p1 TRINITY_DN43048_c0_g1~~TRINITY_DN43048_c0_g1_i1.p1  ORF type:complete len:565 (+),score=71.15 TRINITY_DN43048_c0_g1_i1:30-1697(+)
MKFLVGFFFVACLMALPLQEDLLLEQALRWLQTVPVQEPLRPRIVGSRGNFPSAKFDTLVTTVLKCPQFPIPGLSVSVVTNSEVLHSKGYGVLDLINRTVVNEASLFGIGSCSKSVTSTLLAILQDQGKITFDTPIRKVFPAFRLQGASDATFLDLCTHRSGLARCDTAWLVNNSRPRSVLATQAISAIPPSAAFRYRSQYNNWMLMAAGFAAETATGTPYESAVRNEIFLPAGMNGTLTSVAEALAGKQYALPHALIIDNIGQHVAQPLPEKVNSIIEPLCPAGCILSSARDMARYLQLHLNGGTTAEGKRIVSAMSLGQTHAPAVVFPYGLDLPLFPPLLTLDLYGMGWWVGQYRGRPVRLHTGHVIGHSAVMITLPADNIGVTVLANLDNQLASLLEILLAAVDLALGTEPWVTPGNACKLSPRTSGKNSPTAKPTSAISQQPSAAYAGEYNHPLYGTLRVNTSMGFSWGSASGLLRAGPAADGFVGRFSLWGAYEYENTFQFLRNITGGIVACSAQIEEGIPAITFTNQYYTPQLPGYPLWHPLGTFQPSD